MSQLRSIQPSIQYHFGIGCIFAECLGKAYFLGLDFPVVTDMFPGCSWGFGIIQELGIPHGCDSFAVPEDTG